jgi:Golgi CORVET complex core vacuolar protein 8
MQALVEHCVVRGQPEQVERCVLHMHIASLDFSQVARETVVDDKCITAFDTLMCPLRSPQSE